MKKFNLESYKDLLIEMNEKTNFRFDELSQTRWDVFNVLKTNGYIKKVDRAVYTWAGRKPTKATAKRVAMLTTEYRKSWASSQKDKNVKRSTILRSSGNQNQASIRSGFSPLSSTNQIHSAKFISTMASPKDQS